MTTNNTWITVTGSAIGAIAGGIPGALIGGMIGAIIQESIKCPRCGSIMKFINNHWKCENCMYEHSNNI